VRLTLVTLMLWAAVFSPCLGRAQEGETTPRKIVNKVLPQYPVVANSPRLAGAVRLEVLVSTSGKVKSVEIRGGHPLLAQAAAAAISQWKWEPANHESRETVEVKFVPPPL